jgi:hypothetical protein
MVSAQGRTVRRVAMSLWREEIGYLSGFRGEMEIVETELIAVIGSRVMFMISIWSVRC